MTIRIPGLETRTYGVSGQTLRLGYRSRSNDQPPILLVNGFGCSAELMVPFIEHLDPETGVVVIDPPGIGGSAAPLLPYTMVSLVHRYGLVLDRLGIPQVDVLGVSWGGAVAQQFALQNPRRCRKAVLVSTGALPLINPSWETISEFIRPKRFDPVNGRDIAAKLYGGKVQRDRSLLDVMQREIPNRGGELFQQLAFLGWLSPFLIRKIRQPVLVCHGTEDGLVPPFNARVLETVLPRAETFLFEDGHLGLLTSADVIAPRVEAFRADSTDRSTP